MHDQRKVREELDAHTTACRRAEVSQFASEYNTLLQQRSDYQTEHNVDALQSISALLHKAPHAYTMYNYRREVLLHLWDNREEKDTTIITRKEEKENDTETKTVETITEKRKVDWLKEELKFSSSVILCDHKGYAAFLHRKWVFMHIRQHAEFILTTLAAANKNNTDKDSRENDLNSEKKCPEEVCFWVSALLKEKKQCESLLAVDERNFHAWNYRRWVLEELAQMEEVLLQYSIQLTDIINSVGSTLEKKQEEEKEKEKKEEAALFTLDELKELRFTTAMVRQNFSNYSAWHQRGVIFRAALQRLHDLPAINNNNNNNNIKTEVYNCGYCAIVREAWQQISTDLALLIAAIYCDPLDQSAWYYAQFLEQAAQSLQSLSVCNCQLSIELVDVTGQLIDACTELITEERSSGEMDSSWPRLYLLNALIAAHNNNNNNNNNENNNMDKRGIPMMVIRLARKIYAALHPDDVCDEKEEKKCKDTSSHNDKVEDMHMNSDNNNNNDNRIYTRCVEDLVAQLLQADPLRTGMYNDLCADALRPIQLTEIGE
ncbi:Protein prenyltransferase [Trypanosoma melophagium]|uniref:Protein prenyltransferase n=1 Tax=Trypanosoma melophagium TaxID=715481 RepID=UPI00351AA0B6|nr:Protein prenyltransferase [Trypanosoma melophagium]